jgi:hypothetical protein
VGRVLVVQGLSAVEFLPAQCLVCFTGDAKPFDRFERAGGGRPGSSRRRYVSSTVPIANNAVIVNSRYCIHQSNLLCTRLGMCVIVANIMEQCSLFLPLQRGAGPMALMLWLDWVT